MLLVERCQAGRPAAGPSAGPANGRAAGSADGHLPPQVRRVPRSHIKCIPVQVHWQGTRCIRDLPHGRGHSPARDKRVHVYRGAAVRGAGARRALDGAVARSAAVLGYPRKRTTSARVYAWQVWRHVGLAPAGTLFFFFHRIGVGVVARAPPTSLAPSTAPPQASVPAACGSCCC